MPTVRALVLAALLLWPPSLRADVLFLGDTYFGESYRSPLAGQAEYDAMLAAFAPMLASAALVVANLEAPITTVESVPAGKQKRWMHRAEPQATVGALTAAGIDVLSLANNHAMDYGAAGLEETLRYLEAAELRACGAGSTAAAAETPVELRDSLPLVLLCAHEFRVDDLLRFDVYAEAGKSGVNQLSPARVAEQIAAVRAATPGAFVVAFPHWGDNYEMAGERQRRDGRALIDAGVDLVIGHGAHQLQEVERYRGRWIVYGIGNFVFGSPGRYALYDAPPFSLIARLDLGDRPGLRLYPIVTDNALVGYRPRFATAAEFRQAGDLLRLDLFGEGQDEFGRYLLLPLP